MVNFNDVIFFNLIPRFEGDEWNYRKISTKNIHNDDDDHSCKNDQEKKKDFVNDDGKRRITQESDVKVKKI